MLSETTENIGNIIEEVDNHPVYECTKRVFDIVCSVVGLIIFSPIFLITAAAIMIEDGRPVIFSQTRVKKNGEAFRMYKYRSMHRNAEEELEELLEKNESDGPTFKIENDPRITKVGKFIRSFSIDELPQLVNVLKGDMSIVGPRPPLPCEVEQYNAYQRQRLLVKPGITCYWQCGGRSNLSFDKWVELDVKYIRERGVWCDIKILFKTIPAVFKREGAY